MDAVERARRDLAHLVYQYLKADMHTGMLEEHLQIVHPFNVVGSLIW